MATIDLKSLVGRFNEPCRRALEAAAGLTLSRTHYNVEIEHWLMKLLDAADGDIAAILRHYEVDQARLPDRPQPRARPHEDRQCARAEPVAGYCRTAPSRPGCSPRWSTGGAAPLGASAVGAAGGRDAWRGARARLRASCCSISADLLKRDFAAITANSGEGGDPPWLPSGVRRPLPTAARHAPRGIAGALAQFTIDLTALARAGKIDPVLGRDAEIRQVIDILTRRRQNNPILTGEAGVGKTAVVEGFAMRVASGDVPPALRDVSVRTLDLGLLQAGAGVRGEFENRLKSVIEEVKASPRPIILFIDEAHTLIGAGGAAGQGDAANLLKPALARGELRTIAATTWAEYKKYFEKDAALTRRFQVVQGRGAERGDRDRNGARAGRDTRRSITACASSTRRSARRCGCRRATFRAGSCPTRRYR